MTEAVTGMTDPAAPPSLIDCASPVTIGAQGSTIGPVAAEWVTEFERRRAFAWHDMLDAPFLATVMKLAVGASYVADPRDRGCRSRETPGIAGKALTLALSSASLLAWLEQATGRGPLRRASGSVLQMEQRTDNLYWHDDLQTDPDRVLGVTINLSPQPYTGGDLSLRRKSTTDPLIRHRHETIGSTLIFDVDTTLEHRVLPVTTGGPRRIFTGWFLR